MEADFEISAVAYLHCCSSLFGFSPRERCIMLYRRGILPLSGHPPCEQSELVANAAQPEQSEQVAKAAQPEQSEPVANATQPEQSEPVAKAAQPGQSEPVANAVQPEQRAAKARCKN